VRATLGKHFPACFGSIWLCQFPLFTVDVLDFTVLPLNMKFYSPVQGFSSFLGGFGLT
jgi:hypothetical protein